MGLQHRLCLARCHTTPRLRHQTPCPATLSHARKGRASTRILSASHGAHAGPAPLAGSRTFALSRWQDAPLEPAKFKPAVQHPPGRAELRAFSRRNLASAQTHVAGGCLPWVTRLAVGGHQVPLVINSPLGETPPRRRGGGTARCTARYTASCRTLLQGGFAPWRGCSPR